MVYKINEVNDKITVGSKVRTNGDGRSRELSELISGMVVKVGKEFFWIFHNNESYDGESIGIDPEIYGYKYTWCIGLNSPAYIEYVGEEEAETPFGIITPKSVSRRINKAILLRKAAAVLPHFDEAQEEPNMNILKNLSLTLKKLLSPAMKTQVEAGYRDENLRLTCEAQSALFDILAEKYEEDLTTAAQTILDEREARRKKNA